MKRLAPTLSLLAIAGIAGAEVISDDGAKITVGLYYQGRADVSRGTNAVNDTTSPSENAAGKPDTADFYFRRVRPSIKGTYGDGFLFSVTLSADNFGKPTGAVSLFDAFAGRKFASDIGSHTLVFGKKNAWFYTANSSSVTNLLPSQRPATPVGAVNQVGFGYLYEATQIVRLGVDVLNNVNAGALGANGDDTAAATNDDGEGLWYSARLELTGTGEWTSKWQESFAGKPGTGFVVGLEIGRASDDRVDTDLVTAGVQGSSIDATVYGIEGMLHIDGLTAVADMRGQKTSSDLDAGTNPDDVTARTFSVQAGYAFQSGIALMPVIEPAARFAKIDNNTDIDEEGPALFSGVGDYGASGRSFEVGVNAYFNGHKNKLSLDFIHWQGEDSAVGQEATANIFRVQHQLAF